MSTVAIDFDGVIHKYSRGWQGGKIYDPPMPGAIEAIKEIMEVESVVVFTARTDLEAVCAWLTSYGVECVSYDDWQWSLPSERRGSAFWDDKSRVLVTNRKPAARVYLDDRAVTFGKGGWDQALQDLEMEVAEIEYTYLVTVTVAGTVGHNPSRKVMGPCPLNGEPCDDQTGKHHTILVTSTKSLSQVHEWAEKKWGHCTRVESAPSKIRF